MSDYIKANCSMFRGLDLLQRRGLYPCGGLSPWVENFAVTLCAISLLQMVQSQSCCSHCMKSITGTERMKLLRESSAPINWFEISIMKMTRNVTIRKKTPDKKKLFVSFITLSFSILGNISWYSFEKKKMKLFCWI